MFDQLKKLIRDCLTENDGNSYCPFRVSGAALCVTGIPSFIGSSLYVVYRTEAFDALQFATGFGVMMTGLAVLCGGVALKAKTDTQLDGEGVK